MMVIGLTGGIASGKSTVAAMLENANIPVIDADHLAKELTKESLILKEISSQFAGVLNSDGSLNRSKLADVVFNDPAKLAKLEGILHPKIEEMRKLKLAELEKKGHKIAIYMAPLIFEKALQKTLDKCLLIATKEDLMIERAQKRDGISALDAKNRIRAQMSEEQKRTLADVVIENNGTLSELYQKLVLTFKNCGIDLTTTKL